MSSRWDVPVREYATSGVVSVLPETPLSEVQRILDERGISAVPIIDASGALKGILSTTDLLRVARIEMESPLSLARVWPPPHQAAHVMRTGVITIEEAATLRQAAAKLVEHRIHRLIVTQGDKPTGVLSTRDAVRAILRHHVEAPLETVVTTDLLTVDVGDSIDVAIGRLADGNVHGLVVVDGEWPVGVFTYVEALKARALPPEFRRSAVEQIMSYETICLNVKTPLYRVAGHAIQMNVRRILAVENRKLVGIVSGFDLARYMTLDVTP
jgi:predicted transcriptional regulator